MGYGLPMSETYTHQVAGNVRAAMARAGRGTASELASILRLSQPTARRRWIGEHPYSVDEIDMIARELGEPVATLILPRSA